MSLNQGSQNPPRWGQVMEEYPRHFSILELYPEANLQGRVLTELLVTKSGSQPGLAHTSLWAREALRILCEDKWEPE